MQLLLPYYYFSIIFLIVSLVSYLWEQCPEYWRACWGWFVHCAARTAYVAKETCWNILGLAVLEDMCRPSVPVTTFQNVVDRIWPLTLDLGWGGFFMTHPLPLEHNCWWPVREGGWATKGHPCTREWMDHQVFDEWVDKEPCKSNTRSG